MALGLCCHYIEEVTAPRSGKVSYRNIMDEKVLQLGRWRDGKYTHKQVKDTYVHNARSLFAGFQRIVADGYLSFRVSSALLPLWDQVPQELWDNDEVKAWLRRTGDLALERGVRLTTHPGQFCSLSSESDATVAKSVHELRGHAWLFDAMGTPLSPHAAINIHGAKAGRHRELASVINDLPTNIRSRLTLENDEMSYSVGDLLEVHQLTGTPIVLDTHHHVFNDGGLSQEEAHALTMGTWPSGVKPLQHLSNTDPSLKDGSFTDRRKHSDRVHYIPEPQLEAMRRDEVDVEFEFKLKNLAIAGACNDFGIVL